MQRVLAHGKFILGPEVAELESELGRYVGARHALAVKSGTLALELALRTLRIGAGDEVITTSFSWISAAEAIALVGAVPIFVDIDPVTFLLDPAAVERAVSARTKAIIPVSLFGQMPDLERLGELAADHGLAVIEDGAQSFGASRNGRRSGGATTLAVTSFFPTKPLGCYGDGGALFTNDESLAQRARMLRDHGAERRGEHTLIGVNGRLDTLQAAILLAKLPHLAADLAERRRLAARYTTELPSTLLAPVTAGGNVHVYAQYTLRAQAREHIARSLAERGIETAIYYRRALHQQPVFQRTHAARPLPIAEQAAKEVLSLPLYPGLTDAQQTRVIEVLHDTAS